jgi:nitroimidazol reductase NimA-like FMN-containing flavoprotein (pyridoxamine 5'-phosphate oxidase superfamily)
MNSEGKTTMTGKELEEEIVEFLNKMSSRSGGKRTQPGCNLNHGKACALGTCVDNQPRVTPVDFFNEGMTIWIAGEPGGKIANIMRNPSVSIGIYESVDHRIEQKSLQAWGKAELINLKNNPQAFKKRMTDFGMDEAASGVIEKYAQAGNIPEEEKEAVLEKVSKQLNFIKVVPEKMVLLDMKPDSVALKKIWENGKATIKGPGI